MKISTERDFCTALTILHVTYAGALHSLLRLGSSATAISVREYDHV